eukprot:1692652-Prymnesium_polylepis.1
MLYEPFTQSRQVLRKLPKKSALPPSPFASAHNGAPRRAARGSELGRAVPPKRAPTVANSL